MNFKKKWKRFCDLSSAREGFTLVELIVVIAILAILAGVAVPAYSGYVKKAERAADEALLNEINIAFASACAINGESHIGRSDVPVHDVSSGTFTYTGPFEDSFNDFYEGTGEFKVFESLYYKKEIGGFAEDALRQYAYGDGYITLKESDIAALLGSSFGDIGLTKLAGMVDVATEWVAYMIENPNFEALLWGDANFDSVAKALGFNSSNDEGFMEAWLNLVAQKQALLDADPNNAGEDTYTMAMNQLLANSAVLTAASNASSVSADFMASLGNGTAKDTIIGNINNADGDPGAAVAQAAMAYGMYAAYLTHTGQDVPAEVNLGDVYSVLDDPGFQAYINQDGGTQAQADLEGYLAAMGMISSSSENADASLDVLLNGFSNDQLLDILQGVSGGN